MLDHRLQILLDEHRYQKLERESARRGTSVAAVIREAIDRLPVQEDQRRSAVEAILSAAPMEVPDNPADLRLPFNSSSRSRKIWSSA